MPMGSEITEPQPTEPQVAPTEPQANAAEIVVTPAMIAPPAPIVASQVTAAQTAIQLDTIHDSVTGIPVDAIRVAGYVTGGSHIEWTTADWDRFHNATAKVQINQDPASNPLLGNVLDIEGGAWSIDQAVSAAKERERHNREVNLYISEGALGNLRATLAREGVTHANIWMAHWQLTMQEAISALEVSGDYPIVCVQFASPSSNPNTFVPGGGGKTLKEANVDLSVSLADWLRLPTQPANPPPTVIVATLSVPAVAAKTIKIQSQDGGKTWEQAA